MSIDVTEVDSWATVNVRVKLDPSTTPDADVQYLGRRMQVDYLSAEYRLNPATGWWGCVSVTIAGHRLLKPAPDGTPRIGKDRHKSDYSSWSKGDVQADGSLPEWLDQLVSELRPNGQVTMPGIG